MAEAKTKTKTKTEKVEREYVIPLREKVRPVPRYKKTNKAVKSVKEFLAKHMKIYDRDLKKIKIDRHLNEYLWFRGIRSPPHKVKVKAIKEGDIVKVELVDLPDKLKFKKAHEEKRETKAKEILESSKSTLEKAKEAMKKPQASEETPEEKEAKKEDEKEKKAAVVEEGEKQQKEEAKKEKKTTKVKTPSQEKKEETTTNKAN